ncbi:MAG: prepilin peptidase [Sarcina sp.]
MIFLILIISVILGVLFNFIANFIAVEDFVGEEKASIMKVRDLMNFSINKTKKEKKSLVISILGTVIIFTSLYIKFGFKYEFYKFIFLFAVLIISSIIDIKTKSVYLIVSIVGIIGGLVFSTLNIMDGSDVVTELVSILIPILVLGILKIASRKFDGFGGGDIEVFIFIALYISIIGTCINLILSLIIGGIVAGFSIAKDKRRKKEEKDKYIAFVPYITIATFITVILGNEIIIGYLNLV